MVLSFQLLPILALLVAGIAAATAPVWSTTATRSIRSSPDDPVLAMRQLAVTSKARRMLMYRNFLANTGKVHPMANERAISEHLYSKTFDVRDLYEQAGFSKRDLVSVPLYVSVNKSEDVGGIFHYGSASAGTPRQKIPKVTFDVDFADSSVTSDVFHNKKSSSAKSTGATYDPLGVGKKSPVFVDTLQVGSLSVKNQPIGVLPVGELDPVKGIIGLAGEEVSAFGGQPWIDLAQEQGLIKDRIFGFTFAEKTTTFDIGGVAAAYSDKLTWVPYAEGLGVYQFNATVNGRHVFGILDSVDPTILVPAAQFKAACKSAGGTVTKAHEKDEGDFCSYDSSKSLSITFQVGDLTIHRKGSDLSYGVDGSTGRTDSVLYSNDHNAGWVFGLGILEGLYVAVDKDQGRIGFAPLKEQSGEQITTRSHRKHHHHHHHKHHYGKAKHHHHQSQQQPPQQQDDDESCD